MVALSVRDDDLRLDERRLRAVAQTATNIVRYGMVPRGEDEPPPAGRQAV